MKYVLLISLMVFSGCGKTNSVVGAQGASGTSGLNASSCSVTTLSVGDPQAPNGGFMLVCPDGNSVVQNGAPGPQGPTGSQGQTGANGTNGTNASSWSVVQLCSACTTHYPDTFAEVAFCYAGSLFGTYSSNGGFSSQLPAGAYNSDGINCSCTVNIGSNCSVN